MIRSIALIASLFAALPAHANERPISERVWDGIGIVGTSLGTAVAGGLVGGAICAATCEERPDDFVPDFFPGVAVGVLAGLATGPLIYDVASDGDGSLWGAAGGLAVGGLVGLGGGLLVGKDEGAFIVPLAFVGMGLGYGLFDATSVTPTASIVPDGKGGTWSSFGLSGRF